MRGSEQLPWPDWFGWPRASLRVLSVEPGVVDGYCWAWEDTARSSTAIEIKIHFGILDEPLNNLSDAGTEAVECRRNDRIEVWMFPSRPENQFA
jgi:hypothetical protein